MYVKLLLQVNRVSEIALDRTADLVAGTTLYIPYNSKHNASFQIRDAALCSPHAPPLLGLT